MKLLLLLTFFGASSAFAQDKIYKTSGEVIEAKVIEIGTKEIKYKAFANLNGPIYTIDKQQIIKVVYEAGNTETYKDDLSITNAADEKRAQNIYVEFLGQGLLFTANYNTRFSKKRDGIGGRIGIGAIGGGGDGIVTVPISLNYLLGNGKIFFEVGLGATYISVNANSDSFLSDNSTVIGTMSFMYRLQPIKSGFSFRGGFTPIFTSDGFIPLLCRNQLGLYILK